MKKPNQLFNHYCNGSSSSSLRSKTYFRDIQATNNALPLVHPSSSVYKNHLTTNGIPLKSDKSICDGMNNCHLTDSWANYMNQNVNLSNQQQFHFQHQQHHEHYHILDQNHSNYQFFYKNYLDGNNSSVEREKYVKMTDNNSVSEIHPQQHLTITRC